MAPRPRGFLEQPPLPPLCSSPLLSHIADQVVFPWLWLCQPSVVSKPALPAGGPNSDEPPAGECRVCQRTLSHPLSPRPALSPSRRRGAPGASPPAFEPQGDSRGPRWQQRARRPVHPARQGLDVRTASTSTQPSAPPLAAAAVRNFPLSAWRCWKKCCLSAAGFFWPLVSMDIADVMQKRSAAISGRMACTRVRCSSCAHSRADASRPPRLSPYLPLLRAARASTSWRTSRRRCSRRPRTASPRWWSLPASS